MNIRLSSRVAGLILCFSFLLQVISCNGGGTNTITVTTVSGPSPTECGGYDWKVTYRLASTTTGGGWIVQEIFRVKDVKNCDNTVKEAGTKRFWEAWHVQTGKDYPNTRDTYSINYDDQFAAPDIASSKGYRDVRGKVKFFANATLPATMVQNNPDTFAGILHSDTLQPPFWNSDNATDHNLRVDWNCCDSPHSHTCRTTPETSGLNIPEEESGTMANNDSLAQLIEAIPLWTKGYSDTETKQLISSSKAIAKYSLDDIRRGVASFFKTHKSDKKAIDNLSKVYLLLRVIFDVPQSIERKQAKVFGGWDHPSIEERAEVFNLLWPLELKDSKIQVKGTFSGYHGIIYDAVGEFDFFKAKFKTRKEIR
ncbi:MAG: hypothetical protein HY088_06320 [Ignavibacteriales bacterium]|nr:hypothetical protein [Ignavibacteriales bacterium]